ncbi:MAG: hypothetical protein ACTSW1_15580 [Candidatus Hodarchaeales archaeon]
MDKIPDVEFIEVFNRVTRYVRVGRTNTPKDINKRINRVLRIMRRAVRNAKTERVQKKWRNNHNSLRRLQRKGFADRVFHEAIANPDGIYGLSMTYGAERAREILKQRAIGNIRIATPKVARGTRNARRSRRRKTIPPTIEPEKAGSPRKGRRYVN